MHNQIYILVICFAVSATAGNINTEPEGCHNHLGESVPCLDEVNSENISPRARASALSESVCKNNIGEDVPCQTSEQHIKTWTRSLEKSFGSIDRKIAPNSVNAQVWGTWSNSNLEDSAKSFENLSPHLTFERTGDNAVVIDWDDMRSGDFNNLVTGKLRGILSVAEKVVFLAHGYWAGNSYGCLSTSEWQTEMAAKIRAEEGSSVVTVVVCWASDPIESWSDWFGLTPRFDLGYDSTCISSYKAASGYYESVASTAKMGELLAGMMRAILEDTSITYTHGIGHSLGAHIMGNVYNFGHFKMDRISGLDPAGPCFGTASGSITIVKGSLDNPDTDYKLWGLSKHAAHFVDNIHTDGTYFGSTISKGHLNVFAGDPTGSAAGEQPTCSSSSSSCSHAIAYEYYKATIGSSAYRSFSTSYTLACNERNYSGERTYECLKLGPRRSSLFTYVGYHAPLSGWEEGAGRREADLYLPIAEVGGEVVGPCDQRVLSPWNWGYCSSSEHISSS